MGILKTIDPLLTAELLYVLRSAGHGDVIAVVDANFPAANLALETAWEESVVLAGADLPTTLAAMTSLLPLDRFIDDPVGVMVPSEGNTMPDLAVEVQSQSIAAIEANCGQISCEEVERFDFYEQASEAYAIVQCGAERRPYGCFLLTKGVVGPDGKDLMP
tara:strand:- start:858 stop:1340 length:483 start_codon:yes stop_codon:yes gene_type:complete